MIAKGPGIAGVPRSSHPSQQQEYPEQKSHYPRGEYLDKYKKFEIHQRQKYHAHLHKDNAALQNQQYSQFSHGRGRDNGREGADAHSGLNADSSEDEIEVRRPGQNQQAKHQSELKDPTSSKMTSSDAHLKPSLNPNSKDKYPEVEGTYPYQGT